MNITAKLGTALVAGAIGLGSLAAAPAQATTAQAGPSCVSVTHWTTKTTHKVRVINNCKYSVTYQVKRRGPDSDCLTVAPHQGYTSWWGRWGRQYQGIRWWCA
ncbi:hypothetical protein [Nonomuraea sp. NPDC049758]|uniref:hypothetical protein n=1 Tax=Nonomuraea sp. NPDC049758 TaxID=3154360 RepID=UPI00342A9FD7